MKTKTVLLMLAISSLPSLAFAQGKPAGGSSGGTSSSTPAPTAADTSKILNRDWSNLMKSGRVGDFLAGDVKIVNGSLPWDPIPVTVTCHNSVSFTTNTDPKGNFVIAPTDPKGSTTIKSDPKPVAAQFVGCKIDAILAGYDSNGVTVADRNVLDSPSVGTIVLKHEEGSKGSASSATTASAPKDATKSFEKARTEWLDNKPDRAQKDLEKAVQIYPQFAEAWYQLGRTQEANKSPDAKNSYTKSAAADPQYVLPLERLANLAAQAGNWQELLDDTKHEVELNPRGNIQIWYFSALANVQLKSMDAAEVSAKKSLAMDPLHEQPNTEQLLAVILASRQDYAGALEHLKNCVTYLPAGPNLDLVKQQIAQLEPIVQPAK
jgi:tetratricopeptide (TPR) repeat protein